MSETTAGYALNVLYSYAFEAPSTTRDPGRNDINTARSILLDVVKQLAAAEARASQQAQQIQALTEALADLEWAASEFIHNGADASIKRTVLGLTLINARDRARAAILAAVAAAAEPPRGVEGGV